MWNERDNSSQRMNAFQVGMYVLFRLIINKISVLMQLNCILMQFSGVVGYVLHKFEPHRNLKELFSLFSLFFYFYYSCKSTERMKRKSTLKIRWKNISLQQIHDWSAKCIYFAKLRKSYSTNGTAVVIIEHSFMYKYFVFLLPRKIRALKVRH